MVVVLLALLVGVLVILGGRKGQDVFVTVNPNLVTSPPGASEQGPGNEATPMKAGMDKAGMEAGSGSAVGYSPPAPSPRSEQPKPSVGYSPPAPGPPPSGEEGEKDNPTAIEIGAK
jgi:hypothetical protein